MMQMLFYFSPCSPLSQGYIYIMERSLNEWTQGVLSISQRIKGDKYITETNWTHLSDFIS